MMRLLIVALALLLADCRQRTLPASPARLTAGVAIYEDINYAGAAAHVTADIPDLRTFHGPCAAVDTGDDPYFTKQKRSWGACISSVRVAPGWRATLFDRTNFEGEGVALAGAVPDLTAVRGSCRSGENDCVLSIRVTGPD